MRHRHLRRDKLRNYWHKLVRPFSLHESLQQVLQLTWSNRYHSSFRVALKLFFVALPTVEHWSSDLLHRKGNSLSNYPNLDK